MSRPRPSKATKGLAFSITLLSMANARRDEALKVMGQQVNGYGSGGTGRSGSGHSDPTGLLAAKALDDPRERDRARRAIEEEADLRSQVATIADRYAALIAAYGPSEVADAKAQAETAADNTPRCEGCAAVGYSADYHRRTDMGGILGHPMWLCGWHIKQIRKTGVMPTDLAVHDHHHRRERVAS